MTPRNPYEPPREETEAKPVDFKRRQRFYDGAAFVVLLAAALLLYVVIRVRLNH